MTAAVRTEVCVVDDRKFLLGLDDMYRSAMRAHESSELLKCARVLCEVLGVAPADVPIEGYYSEHADLTEFFRRMRALQYVDSSEQPRVEALPEFRRLKAVTSSPIYGQPGVGRSLLPAGQDPLSRALIELPTNDWHVTDLTAKAREIACADDDCSLVGLAAFAGDPVVLAALRESAVLYAMVAASGIRSPVKITYEWRVDPQLAARARRLVATFNQLFGEKLPAPIPENVEQYWRAACASHVLGRCVRLGIEVRTLPHSHYHWGIAFDPSGEGFVHEFWHQDLWTTERFRQLVHAREPLP